MSDMRQKTEALDGRRGHKMMTVALAKKAPALKSQDGKGDEAMVFAKWFFASWTWYAIELDVETGLAFGLVASGLEVELGYFDIFELGSQVGPLGMLIERDCYFTPCTIAEARAQEAKK